MDPKCLMTKQEAALANPKTESARGRGSRQIILDAIVDLHNAEQVVTREVLSAATGLKMSIVDEHVGNLVDDEKIRRVKAGVFVPLGAHCPARSITRTILPDGTSVLELGDKVEILCPREARMLGEIFSGAAMQYASIQFSHEVGVVNGHNDVLLKEARRRISELEKQVRALTG